MDQSFLPDDDGTARASRSRRYAIEKLHQLRMANGRLKLKTLKARHYRILFLHMEGMSQRNIATIFHLSECHVSLIINDPLSQDFIARGMHDLDGEFRALLGPTAGVLRETLGHPNPEIRLKAADKVLRINGKFDKREDAVRTTAEDLVRQLIAQVPSTLIEKQVNIQVNNGDRIDPFVREALGSFGKETIEWPDKAQSEMASTASQADPQRPEVPSSSEAESPGREETLQAGDDSSG